MRPAPPPLTIERGELPLPGLVARQARGDGGAATQAESRQPPAGQSPAPAKVGPDGTAAERPTDPFEVVSMCGAHEEGHALLAARAWHGPLLAAHREGRRYPLQEQYLQGTEILAV